MLTYPINKPVTIFRLGYQKTRRPQVAHPLTLSTGELKWGNSRLFLYTTVLTCDPYGRANFEQLLMV